MEQNESLDPRVRRTRHSLKEAALELAAERDFNEIGISEIARTAGVNRATFYLHYRDKHELIVDAFDLLLAELACEMISFDEAKASQASGEALPGVVAFFRHVGARAALYRRLLVDSESGAFATRLRAYQAEQFVEFWRHLRLIETPGSPPVALRAEIAAATGQGIIRWWLSGSCRETPEAMATWLWQAVAPLYLEHAMVPSAEPASR